jgi:acyl-CoA reductase-like NAD-dependent aldehyde dehydrogenase
MTMNDETLRKLYDAIKEQQSAAPAVRDMPLDERRRYTADAVAEHRRRQREAIEAGTPELTSANIRNALADAAIAILATNGAGSDEIRSVLGHIFSDKPGAAMTISMKAVSGRIKPKLLKH